MIIRKGLITKGTTTHLIKIKPVFEHFAGLESLLLFLDTGETICLCSFFWSPETLEIEQESLSCVPQCSVTCGVGVIHRSVQCLTNDDQVSSLCHVDLKPEERKTCHNVHDCKSADLHLLLPFSWLQHLFPSNL